MSHAVSQPAFTSAESFDAWAETQIDRWELHDGRAVAMAPERAGHARIKANFYVGLRLAIGKAGLPCEALIDGPMVPGPGLRRFRPDVMVVCGSRPADDAHLVEEPIILVEVLSPSTEQVDSGIKLGSYLALGSLQHYLIVSATARTIIHHRRWSEDQFLTTIVSATSLDLSPPGVTIDFEDIYAGTDLAF